MIGRVLDRVRATGRQHALLICGLVWISAEFFVLGPYSHFMMHDSGDLAVPALSATASIWQNSLWFPFAMAGTDLAATGMIGGLDRLLFWLLPDWLAIATVSVGMVVLAGAFTYLLCRNVSGLSHEAATCAGLAFALFVGNGQFYRTSIALLPLLICAIDRGLDPRRRPAQRWTWLILAPLAYGTIAHIQIMVPFPLLVAAAWFLCIKPRRPPGEWLKIALALALPLVARLQDLVAIALLSPESHRSKWTDFDLESPLAKFLDTILGEPLAGDSKTILLALGALAWILLRPRPPMLKHVTAALVCILAVTTALDLVKPLLVAVVPKLSMYQFRIGMAIPFAIVMFGAFGLEALLRLGRSRFARPRLAYGALLGALFLLSIPLKINSVEGWVKTGNHVQVFNNPIVAEFAKAHPVASSPYRVEAFQMFQTDFHAYGLETTGGYITLYSRRFHDYWEQVIAPLAGHDARAQAALHKFRDWGSRVNLNANLRMPELELGRYVNLDLLALANTRYIFSRDRLTDTRLLELRRAERPWNSMTTREKALASIGANFSGKREVYIYENRDALPRFFVAYRVRRFGDARSLLAALRETPIRDLASNVFIEGESPPGLDAGSPAASPYTIAIKTYAPDVIRIRVESERRGILVVSNSYNPWWSCASNRTKCSIFPAYRAFWGVLIEQGATEIEFRYQPPYSLR